MQTLTPATGIIYTAMQSGMSYVDAASEMADNSFAPGAGAAEAMWVVYTEDSVLFMDKGAGVSDLNNMFRLGSSGSRGNSEDIGRFGVGSKFGALTYGSKVTVHTVRDGVFHTFGVDWAEVLRSEKWPNAYAGRGADASKAPKFIRDGGTIILIENIRNGKSLRIGSNFKRQLGMRFMQSFESMNDIFIARALTSQDAMAGRFTECASLGECVVEDVRTNTTDKGRASIVVRTEDGRQLKAKVMYGRLPDGDSSMSGVHISFGGRTIETEQRRFDESRKVPSQFMAMVFLDKRGWKECLNYNKTRVTDYREELLAEVANSAKDLLELLQEESEAARQTSLELNMSNMMSEMLGSMFKNDPAGVFSDGDDIEATEITDGENEGDDGDREGGTDAGKTNGVQSGSGKRRAGSFAVNFNFAWKGEKAGTVFVDVDNVATRPVFNVTLNTAVRVIAANKEREPANADSLCLLAVYGIAREIASNDQLRRKMLGEDMSDMSSKDVYDELLMRMTPEVGATKTKKRAAR